MRLFTRRRVSLNIVVGITLILILGLGLVDVHHSLHMDNIVEDSQEKTKNKVNGPKAIVILERENNNSSPMRCEQSVGSVTVLSRNLEYRQAWPRTRGCSNFTIRHLIPKCRLPVALASFPGSGNTWLRQMIEEASGIFTGSRYKDLQLQLQGFYGEARGWDDGTTLVQKTHDASEHHVVQTFGGRGVLLLRNPYSAIMATHNFMYGGHRGLAPTTDYEREEWSRFVSLQMHKWLHMATNFTLFSEKLLVLHYEELQRDSEGQLRRLLNFLDVPVSEARFECLRASEKPFKRMKPPHTGQIWLQAFNKDIRGQVDRIIDELDRLLINKGHPHLPLNLYQVYNKTDDELLKQTRNDEEQNAKPSIDDDDVEGEQMEERDKAKGALLVLDELITWGERHPHQSKGLLNPTLLGHLRTQLGSESSSKGALSLLLKVLEVWPQLKRPFLKVDPLLQALEEGSYTLNDLSHLHIP